MWLVCTIDYTWCYCPSYIYMDRFKSNQTSRILHFSDLFSKIEGKFWLSKNLSLKFQNWVIGCNSQMRVSVKQVKMCNKCVKMRVKVQTLLSSLFMICHIVLKIQFNLIEGNPAGKCFSFGVQGNFEGNVLNNEGKCYTRILMLFFKKVLFLIPFHINIFIGLPVIIFIEISSKKRNCDVI